MDKYEKRRTALQVLVDGLGRGGISKIAERLGKDPSYISRLLYPPTKAGHKRMGEDMVDALNHAFPAWQGDVNVQFGLTLDLTQRKYPVISFVQAGQWREIVDSFPRGAGEDYIQASINYGRQTFVLKIIGTSMEPIFSEGDMILVDPDIAPKPGDFVVAKNDEEEATFKKYRPRGTNETGETVFELVPLNDDYATLRSDHQPIEIIGTMVEHRRFRKG